MDSLSPTKIFLNSFLFDDLFLVILFAVFSLVLYQYVSKLLGNFVWRKNQTLFFTKYNVILKIFFFLLIVSLLFRIFLIGEDQILVYINIAFFFILFIISFYPIREIFSALLLFLNKSVQVNEIIKFESIVGTVKKTNLLYVLLETDNGNDLYIPNSKLLSGHFFHIKAESKEDSIRFNVAIQAASAYDAKCILKEAAYSSPYINYFVRNEFLILSGQKKDNKFEVMANVTAKKSWYKDSLKSDIVQQILSLEEIYDENSKVPKSNDTD